MKIRTNHTTTVDDNLWYLAKVIAMAKSKKEYTTLNTLIEEGLEYIIKKNQKLLPLELQEKK